MKASLILIFFGMTFPAHYASSSLVQALEHSLGMLVITDRAGVAVYANEGAHRRTGYAVAETIGKKPGQLWGGHMSPSFYASLWEDLLAGRPVVTNIENKRKDGQRYQERLNIAPLYGPEGKAELFVAARPFHQDEPGRDASFDEEFQRVFGVGRELSAHDWCGWVERWFVPEVTQTQSQIWGKSSDSALSLVETMFLAPLRERFVSRETDRILVIASQADPREFRLLYSKYHSLVRAYFVRHIEQDGDTADDLTQETFYRALASLPGFTPTNASYGTYLLRVAHNLLVNHYRKKQAWAWNDDVELAEAASGPRACHVPEMSILDTPELRPAERALLTMKYQEGLSVREIAAFLGASENAVKLRLSRARKHLRELLEEG